MNLWRRLRELPMPKRHYLLAIGGCLLIPAVVIVSGVLIFLIDPELARGHADYARNFHLLQQIQIGAWMVMMGVVVLLWLLTCYWLLKSKQRAKGWLLLAAMGPFGLIGIAMLSDQSPAPGDLYQRLIGRLKLYWRIPLEIALFLGFSSIAFTLVMLQSELSVRYESFTTGAPVSTIIDVRNASSGMWAFSEGMEQLYLIVLIYLCGPILFNFAGHLFVTRTAQRA